MKYSGLSTEEKIACDVKRGSVMSLAWSESPIIGCAANRFAGNVSLFRHFTDKDIEIGADFV